MAVRFQQPPPGSHAMSHGGARLPVEATPTRPHLAQSESSSSLKAEVVEQEGLDDLLG